MLPTTGPLFSERDWVEGEGAPGGFLSVSARYVDMAVASRLPTVWMNTAMNTLMAAPRSSDLRLWFLFDELGAPHRLPASEKGLQTARNYGGAIVVGIHAYAKLKETYGDDAGGARAHQAGPRDCRPGVRNLVLGLYRPPAILREEGGLQLRL